MAPLSILLDYHICGAFYRTTSLGLLPLFHENDYSGVPASRTVASGGNTSETEAQSRSRSEMKACRQHCGRKEKRCCDAIMIEHNGPQTADWVPLRTEQWEQKEEEAHLSRLSLRIAQ